MTEEIEIAKDDLVLGDVELVMVLGMFREALEEKRGADAEKYFWNAVRRIWTKDQFYIHHDAIRIVHALCNRENRRIALFGAKHCGKSKTMAVWMLVVWWAFWGKCMCIYRTTTLEQARTRGWGELEVMFSLAQKNKEMPGKYMKTRPPFIKMSDESSNEKAVIRCMATKKDSSAASGNTGDLEGQHMDVTIIFDDELNKMNGMPHKGAIALDSPNKIFWYVAAGNPDSWDNALGDLGMPHGMPKEDIYKKDLDDWPIRIGVGLRFNAYKSPNILLGKDESGKWLGKLENGKWRYPHLHTPETIKAFLDSVDGNKACVPYYRFILAIPSPSGNSQTVITRQLVEQFDGNKIATFASNEFTIGAGLDPSYRYGGDRCVLQFLRWGTLLDGKFGIEFLNHEIVPIPASLNENSTYLIVERVKNLCLANGVRPENFCGDFTAAGKTLYDVFRREWSEDIKQVSFLGKPMHDIVSTNINMTGREYFYDRSSELVYSMYLYIHNGQIRGLCDIVPNHGYTARQNDEIILEGIGRRFDMKSDKLRVEPKHDMEMEGSPDRWDAAIVGLDMVRQLGYHPGFGGSPKSTTLDVSQLSPRLRKILGIDEHEYSDGYETSNNKSMSGFAE